jgi:septal ring factor EnvC (AmiA/AmiB activator)
MIKFLSKLKFKNEFFRELQWEIWKNEILIAFGEKPAQDMKEAIEKQKKEAEQIEAEIKRLENSPLRADREYKKELNKKLEELLQQIKNDEKLFISFTSKIEAMKKQIKQNKELVDFAKKYF